MSTEVQIEYKQASITPFWQKLPFFLLFPLRTGPLIFIVCIVAASAGAGLLLGNFGFAFKGILAYLGLRYAFNVLDLFSQGRFESDSPDHTLWGPEKRPAKLALVLLLLTSIGIGIGNVVIADRVANNPKVQEQLLDNYKAEHAEEIAEYARDMAAAAQRASQDAEADAAQDDSDDASAASAQASVPAPRSEAAPATPAADTTYGELSRAEVLALQKPGLKDPMWVRLQPVWFWLLMAALSLILPSAAVVIALEDRFFKALNPGHVVELVRAMGSAYFGIWALFLIIGGARTWALSAGTGLPTLVRFPLEMGLATYLGLVLFAMMGYALYQFHQELNLDVKVDFDTHRQAGGAEAIARAGSAQAAQRAAQSQDPLERKLQALLAVGNVKEAIAEVKDQMRYERFDPDLNSRLHRLYQTQGDKAVILAHGPQWITSLTRVGRDDDALAATQAMVALDPSYTIEEADQILPIAKRALQKHDAKLTAALIKGFDKRFPQHKDTPDIYFIGAQLASEHMRQHAHAAKILTSMLKHYPKARVANEAKQYLTVLETMLAQSDTKASAA